MIKFEIENLINAEFRYKRDYFVFLLSQIFSADSLYFLFRSHRKNDG